MKSSLYPPPQRQRLNHSSRDRAVRSEAHRRPLSMPWCERNDPLYSSASLDCILQGTVEFLASVTCRTGICLLPNANASDSEDTIQRRVPNQRDRLTGMAGSVLITRPCTSMTSVSEIVSSRLSPTFSTFIVSSNLVSFTKVWTSVFVRELKVLAICKGSRLRSIFSVRSLETEKTVLWSSVEKTPGWRRYWMDGNDLLFVVITVFL